MKRAFKNHSVKLLMSIVMILCVTLTSGLSVKMQASNENQIVLERMLSGFYQSIDEAPSSKHISVGAQIPVYIVTEKQKLENVGGLLPVYEAQRLVLFVVNNESTHDSTVTQGLVKELEGMVDSSASIAVIYDRNQCCVYDRSRKQTTVLHTFEEQTSGRGTLSECTAWQSEVLTQTLRTNDCTHLSLETINESETRSYPYCSISGISVVLQAPYLHLCWAASTACIGNYLSGSNYTAAGISQLIHGSSNYDVSGTISDCQGIMTSIIGSSYPYSANATPPSDYRIYYNLSYNKPLFGRWAVIDSEEGTTGFHLTVIYGMYNSANLIYVMDPASGFTSASNAYSSSYSYTSVNNWNYLLLVGYCSKFNVN